MALWDRVVEIANKAMNTEASQILSELKAECPKRTGKTAASFHIMKAGSDMSTGVIGANGLITKIQIGSTLDSAYFADQGNGQRMIYPVRAKALKYSDGTFHAYSTPYEGTHFVQKVADRHR